MTAIRWHKLILATVLALPWVLAAPVLAQIAGPPPKTTYAQQNRADLPDSVKAMLANQPFFLGIQNTPKAGVRANVRQYTYYSELLTTLTFKQSSSFRNTLDWSWEDFRQQDKTAEKINDNFTYGFGNQLPFIMSLTGRWNWSEEKTVNTAGLANLFKRNNRSMNMTASKTSFRTGDFVNSVNLDAGLDNQNSVNQGQRNDGQDARGSMGVQSGYDIADGLVLAGRAYGQATSGDRTLAGQSSPSSSLGDSLGVGIYYAKSFSTGRVAITRSTFRRDFLDWQRNSNGLIDTVGLDDSKKVVDETETKDALSLQAQTSLKVWRAEFDATYSHSTNDVDYTNNRSGLKERFNDRMDLGLTFGVGRDSFAVDYEWKWKWDNQRIQGATTMRGKQYNKDRNFDIQWFREIFTATKMTVRYHEGLVQDTAENQHNENDKDRHQIDLSARLERYWAPRFRAGMSFSYQQVQDHSLRASRSANNNGLNTYEIAPSYAWTLAPWLGLDQSYRLYIQYTNYDFGYLDAVNKDDNYNKRGNLTTKVTINPTGRVDLVLRHDYNQRFNATKLATDAAGNAVYSRDLNQKISSLVFNLTFRVAPGVKLEASTERTRDDRENFGRIDNETRNYSGKIWVGALVSQRWGTASPLELSAMVKKYNAFGPSVTETSSNYWEADVWLKWVF